MGGDNANQKCGTSAPEAIIVDYLIGEESLVGQGLGPRVIGAFVDLAFQRYPELSPVVAAPQQAHRPSWRAPEKAGFVRRWAGMLDSDDPDDAGPAYIYSRDRATASGKF